MAAPGEWSISRMATAVVVATAAVASSIAVGHRSADALPPGYVVLIFLLGVLVVAVISGLWAGILAALASFFAYNFFFVQPTWTFAVADSKEVFALGVFLTVAVLTGGLAGRLREVADAARRRADTLAFVHDFAERVSALRDPDAIRALLVRLVAERIHGTAVVVDRAAAALGTCEAWPEAPDFTTDERRAMLQVLDSGRTAPAIAPGFAERRFEFRPLTTTSGVVATIGLAPGSGARRVDPDDERGLSALLDHAATALERARFADESAAAEAAAERERLRSALLSSISHDLRTPLATILGSVTSLRQLGDRMDPADRADLLAAIEEETDRLSRFVADLLAMTRLEAGLDLRRDWVDLADPVRAAAEHLRRVHPRHPIVVDVSAPPPPPVRGEATLLEQVVFNLGDNAVKASPDGAPVRLSVARDGEAIVVAVSDRGRGLSADDIDRLFVRALPRSSASSPEARGGLGLGVARRVVEATGGVMTAESPGNGGLGTRVSIRLPIEAMDLPGETEAREG